MNKRAWGAMTPMAPHASSPTPMGDPIAEKMRAIRNFVSARILACSAMGVALHAVRWVWPCMQCKEVHYLL